MQRGQEEKDQDQEVRKRRKQKEGVERREQVEGWEESGISGWKATLEETRR